MTSWKENKTVGVVAGIVAITCITIVIIYMVKSKPKVEKPQEEGRDDEINYSIQK